jgi:hypothetical protein
MADGPEKRLFDPFTCPTCWTMIEKPEQLRIVVVSHDKEQDIYHVKKYCRKCHPAPAPAAPAAKGAPKGHTN